MHKKNPSLVFFGSGPVAAASLSLLKDYFIIEAIITKPTTKVQLELAAPGIEVLTVRSKHELDNVIDTARFSSEIAVLIDFGIIISQHTIDYFKYGIINSHFSLLPALRGADPITFAILENYQHTGVSLMRVVSAMDEGPILGYKIVPLTGAETGTTLTALLIQESATLLRTTLPLYLAQKIRLYTQEEMSLIHGQQTSYTRKLTKLDGVLDFNKNADVLCREIRGFDAWPKSRTHVGAVEVIIVDAKVAPISLDTTVYTSGAVLLSTDHAHLYIVCGTQSVLEVMSLRPSGKNTMNARAFVSGYLHRLSASITEM